MRYLFTHRKVVLIVLLIFVAAGILISTFHPTPIDYSTQVKPIINKKCIACHGGVKQQGGFSLLFREDALGKTKSGRPAIIPGDASASEFIKRIKSTDPEERMPYKHEPLSKEEIKILEDWVDQGAKWGEHWAYVPVQQQELPSGGQGFFSRGKKNDWGNNGVDAFVLQQLKEHQLSPAEQADKSTLLRRVSLDLTGMPAPASLTAKYMNSTGPDGYVQLVDSLMASPHYGERWTAVWLDLARYADTKGYERDDYRNMWRYRDWLINAFNSDKPYNVFLTEQLAGDLLPHPSDEQLIATAFHRNTMTNDEGGTDNEEFRTAAVMDRVSSTWEGLLGTTFSCVQCHSHPYDPFRHDDYYKFLAFFNNTRDEDTQADYPLLRHFSDSDRMQLDSLSAWLALHATMSEKETVLKFLKTWQPSINSLTADRLINAEISDSKWFALRNNGSGRLRNVCLTGTDELVLRLQQFVKGGVLRIRMDSVSGPELVRINSDDHPVPDWYNRRVGFKRVEGYHDLYFEYSNPALKDKPNASGLMFDWFYFGKTFPGKGQPGFERAAAQYWWLAGAATDNTPIMDENPVTMRRTTQVFERGNWLMKGARVEPDVPHSLNPMPADAPRNRLGLAMWLTSKQNPLTARTLVNRVWEQLFGKGLVETLEDIGSQGAQPTHRALLDYLSYRFMNEDGWSIKKLIREIVLSATYQESSIASPASQSADPDNRWYSRGVRVRLSAEEIRDQALSVSGMLSEKLGGPSVMPYQPEGIWLSPWNGRNWQKSKDGDQYRRGIYTFWKRTAAYPSMITYDGVSREVCSARRIRTNTPLQALVTLNDPVYFEAAEHLALEAVRQFPGDENAQIRWCYHRAMGKEIGDRQLLVLKELYRTTADQFRKDPAGMHKMVDSVFKMGEGAALGKTGGTAGKMVPGAMIPGRTEQDTAMAALIMVANTVMNIDEFITKN
jgi:uncharacterized protein DUF1553/uncharacterized protein DUF1549/cytochrome c